MPAETAPDRRETGSSSSGSASTEQIIQLNAFSGPLPTPETLEAFDRVLPGLAREIVDRSELEMRHRHKLDSAALSARVEDQRAARTERARGQYMAFAIVIIMVAGGISLTVIGHAVVGAGMMGTTLIGLVSVFITGKLVSVNGRSSEDAKQEADS